jgi:two-component system sensor histidine kinase UhpB
MAVTAAHEQSDTQQITHSIVEICDHLMTVLRSMMKQLHPLILTELGLKATLEDLLHHWQTRTPSTTFNLHVDDAVDHLDKTIVIQVFRVIQESLTNIIRHAQASEVTIRLNIDKTADRLELNIEDNGLGCNLMDISTGFGLQGMAERVKLLGGLFELKSAPNKGMLITALIPIRKDI